MELVCLRPSRDLGFRRSYATEIDSETSSDASGQRWRDSVARMLCAARKVSSRYRNGVIWGHHLSFVHTAAAYQLASELNWRLILQLHGSEEEYLSDERHMEWAKKVIARADRVIAPSQYCLRSVFEKMGLDAQPSCDVIPLFLPDHIVDRIGNEQAIPLSGKVVFVGRIDSNKGWEIAAKAASISKMCSSLCIVGDGSEMQSLRHFVYSNKSAREKITILGPMDRNSVIDEMLSSDILVVPTKKYEGFSLVTLEGLACGRPIIASSAGAIPEVLGMAGLVLDKMEYHSLSLSIDSLFSDEKKMHEMAKSSRCRFEQINHKKRHARAFTSILSSL